MKADLTMSNTGLARHLAQTACDGNTFFERVCVAIGQTKDWLLSDSRPNLGEGALLPNADLERRIVMVNNPECHDFFWRS
ncbi:hypothetical protein GALL_192580 [mine drainage metagenome]|uniref:Uncharacterized protein n=1 Tax=mine drainage metagenome TaxID=410659 RepID=A0A1J5SEY0_9ZZZZ